MSAWYTDGCLDGRQWTLIKGSHVQTPDGAVLLPMKHGNGAPQNALYLRVAHDGSRFACVGNDDDHCWEWVSGAWLDRGIAFGPQSVLYDNDGVLHIVPPPEAFGYRYVKPNNQLVTCTDSHFDPALKIWDYTKLGDVFIGQGGDGPHGDDPCIAIESDGSRRLISEGRCRFINAYREGDAFAIYCVREDILTAEKFLLTRAEISELPEIDAEPVDPPIEWPEPIGRALGVLWYEQQGPPEKLTPPKPLCPGNGENAVRKYPKAMRPWPVVVTDDTVGFAEPVLAYRVGSEAADLGDDDDTKLRKMEDKAARLHAEGYRINFYWDSRRPPRWPSIPKGSIYQIMGFCFARESVAQCEADLERVIVEAEQRYEYLSLACQSHTTNADLTKNLRPLPAMYVRLAKRHPRLVLFEPFCHSGRDLPDGSAGGLTANEYMRPIWEHVMRGITGFPNFGTGGGGGGVADPTIDILDYDKKVSRRDPKGLLVRFDVSGERIAKIALSMEGDGEPPVTAEFPSGPDGRYLRAIAFKPVRTGDWFPLVKAWDEKGKMATARGATKVKVTEDSVDPVDPIDPDSLIAPNQLETVQAAMRDHPEIDTMNEDTRGKIIDYACASLGGKPWGRKARNQDGSNKNTDGMTFLRSDGKFEIYDAISGHDGSATWEGFGPFKPGENGWWAPHEPV